MQRKHSPGGAGKPARGPDRSTGNTVRALLFRQKWEREFILYTIAVVLLILWLLGLVTSYTMGGFIHILIVVAIVVVLLRIISGRKVL